MKKVKQGQKVRELRSGTGLVGRVKDVRDTQKGIWVDVNFGEPRKPEQIKSFRKSQLEAA